MMNKRKRAKLHSGDAVAVIVVAILVMASLSGFYLYTTASPVTPSLSPSPTPTPTPSPTPTSPPPYNVNLAIIPDDWDLNYKTGPQIIHLDATVLHNGHASIRIDQHTSADLNTARECDLHWPNWPTVNPGDHVVAKVWIRVLTGSSTPGYPQCGGRIGIDFYAGSLLPATAFWTAYFGGDFSRMYVHDSNGGAWQQKVLDFTVPATVGDSNGNPVKPTSIVLWMQGWNMVLGGTDPLSVWFADAELYINPV